MYCGELLAGVGLVDGIVFQAQSKERATSIYCSVNRFRKFEQEEAEAAEEFFGLCCLCFLLLMNMH